MDCLLVENRYNYRAKRWLRVIARPDVTDRNRFLSKRAGTDVPKVCEPVTRISPDSRMACYSHNLGIVGRRSVAGNVDVGVLWPTHTGWLEPDGT